MQEWMNMKVHMNIVLLPVNFLVLSVSSCAPQLCEGG